MREHSHLLPSIACFAPIALYAVGTARLWHKNGIGGGATPAQFVFAVFGFVTLMACLLPPLSHLAEDLFSAHMAEHELLMAVAAPLIVAARPGAAMFLGLPRLLRRVSAATIMAVRKSPIWVFLTRPLTATILHGIAIWIWHLPVLFTDALAHGWLHWFQHASFFLTGLLFWWALFQRTTGDGVAVGHLFATAMHTGLLGALLTFSTRLWYPAALNVSNWGLTPIEDQQLAGIVMWIPAGIVYALAALILAGRWIATTALQTHELVHANTK
jgi:cytochrome c oxidase assembly factor CtaG